MKRDGTLNTQGSGGLIVKRDGTLATQGSGRLIYKRDNTLSTQGSGALYLKRDNAAGGNAEDSEVPLEVADPLRHSRGVRVNLRLILRLTGLDSRTMQSEQAQMRRTSLGSRRTRLVRSWVTQQFVSPVSIRVLRLKRRRPGSMKATSSANMGNASGWQQHWSDSRVTQTRASAVRRPHRHLKANRYSNVPSRRGKPARTPSKLNGHVKLLLPMMPSRHSLLRLRIRKQDSS